MSKNMSTIISTTISRSKSAKLWNEAIADARRLIDAFSQSITAFEELRDRGVPFPGQVDERRSGRLDMPGKKESV